MGRAGSTGQSFQVSSCTIPFISTFFPLSHMYAQNQFFLFFFSSIGSMLGLDRPYIASSLKSSDEESDTICLEYGSATQLYLVPFVQHEEQVSQLIIL